MQKNQKYIAPAHGFRPRSYAGAAYNRKPYKRVDGRTDRPSWRPFNAHTIRCDARRHPVERDEKRAELRRAALEYHEFPTPGKIAICATKQLTNQRDLALAYSPGVAAPCEEIVKDPNAAFKYTSRGNLVAVITNGTAVLGLGDIGPLASKPVMEGKGVLFKKFAGVDVFDIEIDEKDPAKLVEIIASLEPTFGAINLEDIKAPDCFYVERELRKRMKIPVFHDDQHGTAITVGAAMLNALKVAGKDPKKVKLVTSGAGAAALACLGLLLKLGIPRENIYVTDLAGVVYEGRTELMDEDKIQFAQPTQARTLGEIIEGADVFLGLSAGGVLKKEMVAKMAANPIIFALANPNPEITPEDVKSVRDDAIIATGRSDYPNQVNNVLCFPYIFRGALDAGASTITIEMEIAAVHAIAELAQAEQSEVVAAAYCGEKLTFGPEYLIPKPFDPRLMMKIAPAVAQAAADSGVALRPIADMDHYRERLQSFVYASGTIMKPIFTAAKAASRKRVAYAEGEEERVLRACQIVVDEGLARPTLIGRPAIIAQRIEKFGLRLKEELDYDVVNVEQDQPLPRLLADLPPPDRAQRRDGADGQDRDAPPPDPDCRHAAAQGRCGRPDLRHLGHDGPPSGLPGPGHRQARRRQHLCLHERADAAGPPGVLARHPRQLRPDGRAAGRNHHHGGRGNDALRHQAQGRAAVAFELRLVQPPERPENAPHARTAARADALARSRWRNARRRGAGRRGRAASSCPTAR